MPRKLLMAVSAICLAAVLEVACADRAGAQIPVTVDTTGPVRLTHGPYLQLPAATAMTIVWHTNRRCVSRVEYGTGEVLDMKAVGSKHGLIENRKTSHVVRLTGLEPGTTYRYRVVSKEFLGYERQHIVSWGDSVMSEVYTFTTFDPRKEAFSFCTISDVHERAEELASVMSGGEWKGIDFAVYNGDFINDFMRPDQMFTGFLDVTVDAFAREMPFIFARGNHEVRGRYARDIPDFIPTLDSRAYYSFDHGPVHFIVLDSGEDKEDEHEYYNGLVDFVRYREEQAEWLKEDLQSESFRNAKYRIVISHIPPRGARGFAAQSVREHFEPPINAAGVDLWLSGHTHRFSRIDPAEGENEYLLIIGPVLATTRVDISGEGMIVTVTGMEGEILDTVTLPPH